jgi:hypothetical protein
MNEEREKQLEMIIHRELRRLPERHAPETLLHRVMLTIHERTRKPWWHRPWLAWPFGAQVVSLAVLLVCAAVVSFFLESLWEGVNLSAIPTQVADSLAWLKPIGAAAAAFLNALLAALRLTWQQCLLIGTAVVLFSYLSCVAVGTACYRLAYHRS